MTNSAAKAKQVLINSVFQELNPDLFKACEILTQPLVENISLVPCIYSKIREAIGEFDYEQMPFIVAVLYRLYVPIQLFSKNTKKPIGLRDAFASALGYDNPENINGWGDILLAYYKGQKFAERVDELAFAIYHDLKTNGELMGNNPEIAPLPQPFEKAEKGGFMTKMLIRILEGQNKHINGAENALLF
jgi:hypothetical protein